MELLRIFISAFIPLAALVTAKFVFKKAGLGNIMSPKNALTMSSSAATHIGGMRKTSQKLSAPTAFGRRLTQMQTRYGLVSGTKKAIDWQRGQLKERGAMYGKAALLPITAPIAAGKKTMEVGRRARGAATEASRKIGDWQAGIPQLERAQKKADKKATKTTEQIEQEAQKTATAEERETRRNEAREWKELPAVAKKKIDPRNRLVPAVIAATQTVKPSSSKPAGPRPVGTLGQRLSPPEVASQKSASTKPLTSRQAAEIYAETTDALSVPLVQAEPDATAIPVSSQPESAVTKRTQPKPVTKKQPKTLPTPMQSGSRSGRAKRNVEQRKKETVTAGAVLAAVAFPGSEPLTKPAETVAGNQPKTVTPKPEPAVQTSSRTAPQILAGPGPKPGTLGHKIEARKTEQATAAVSALTASGMIQPGTTPKPVKKPVSTIGGRQPKTDFVATPLDTQTEPVLNAPTASALPTVVPPAPQKPSVKTSNRTPETPLPAIQPNEKKPALGTPDRSIPRTDVPSLQNPKQAPKTVPLSVPTQKSGQPADPEIAPQIAATIPTNAPLPQQQNPARTIDAPGTGPTIKPDQQQNAPLGLPATPQTTAPLTAPRIAPTNPVTAEQRELGVNGPITSPTPIQSTPATARPVQPSPDGPSLQTGAPDPQTPTQRTVSSREPIAPPPVQQTSPPLPNVPVVAPQPPAQQTIPSPLPTQTPPVSAPNVPVIAPQPPSEPAVIAPTPTAPSTPAPTLPTVAAPTTPVIQPAPSIVEPPNITPPAQQTVPQPGQSTPPTQTLPTAQTQPEPVPVPTSVVVTPAPVVQTETQAPAPVIVPSPSQEKAPARVDVPPDTTVLRPAPQPERAQETVTPSPAPLPRPTTPTEIPATQQYVPVAEPVQPVRPPERVNVTTPSTPPRPNVQKEKSAQSDSATQRREPQPEQPVKRGATCGWFGLSATQTETYREAGVTDSEDWRQWSSAFPNATANEIRTAIVSGVKTGAVAVAYAQAGCRNISEASAWASSSVTPRIAATWIRDGINMSEAWDWTRIPGIKSADDVHLWSYGFDGKTPNKKLVRDLTNLGVTAASSVGWAEWLNDNGYGALSVSSVEAALAEYPDLEFEVTGDDSDD